jgi:transketolase
MAAREEIRRLEHAALDIRRWLLKLCTQQVMHIGGDLSVADIMTALWQYGINYDPDDPKKETRDRFILSKGHAAAVTSYSQAAIGCYDPEDINREYAADNGRFAMHSCNLINPHVEVSTGSLGHGLPVGGGMAAALRLKGNRRSRVYVVMGDGEQSEGSIWEAAMNAAQQKLGNLVGIIDSNKLCFDGTIDQISGLGDVGEKYRSFGWRTVDVDGHDMEALIKAFDELPAADSDQPTLLLCHTVKGKGVDFMEDEVKWHAGKLSDENCLDAVSHLEGEFENRWGSLDE